MKMIFNLVGSCKNKTMDVFETTWADMLVVLMKTKLRKGEMTLTEYQSASDIDRKAEKDGPAWIPCSLVDQSGPRTLANMDQIYFVVLDIDTGMHLDDVKARLEGFEAVIHSSFSHSLEKPKWRVTLPLKEELPATDIGKVFDYFQERFDGLLDASCGHDPSRLYFLPGCPADAEHLFVAEHLEGDFVDGRGILSQATTVPVKAPVTRGVRDPASGATGVAEGGRNNDLFKHACRLFDTGLSQDDVLDECLKRNESNVPPLNEKEVKVVVASAGKRVAGKISASAMEVDEIVEAFNQKYAWIEKHGRIFRFKHRDFVAFETLRQQYANTSLRVSIGGSEKCLNYAEIWHRSELRKTYEIVSFIPGEGEIVGNAVNLWKGWGAKPSAGDVSPWTDLLDYVFGGDAAMHTWFEQWAAFSFQHPGAKLSTAVVLWSAKQGVGKSMVGETIGKLYGDHFRTITAVELHGSFNGWMRECQFVLGEENASSDQRADANRLKHLITGATIHVNEKHQPALEMPNSMNFLFTSNHPDAFYLEDTDRRFFIWEIAGARKPDAFYEHFVDWRDNKGGLSILMDHLLKLDLTGFLPKGNAPVTEAKEEMIRESKSDVERYLEDTLGDPLSVKAVFGKEVATLDEITETYRRERHCRMTTTAMSKALRRGHVLVKRRATTSCGRKMLVSLANHEKWELADSPAWVAEYERPAPGVM